MGDDGVSSVVAWLPAGVRVLSTVIPGRTPPGHVYRVVSSGGLVLGEFVTLVELYGFLNGEPPM